MKVTIITILLIVISTIYVYSQTVPIFKIEDLEKRIKNNSDTTYIVNFWATWCVPCIKELPDLDSINATYRNSKIKVLLVSIDFKEDINSKLLPFIIAKKVRSEVVLLDEVNGNYFIPKISNEWSGSIPATLIINYHKNVNRFFEKKINYEFLKNEIEGVK